MIEFPQEILPVLDLKNGQVVHAVAGQREKYKPLVSRWTPFASDPIKLTAALATQLGLREYYVADLNAIELQSNNHLPILQQLLDQDLSLWLDAGFNNLHDVEMYIKLGVQRIILSSESLPQLSLVHEAVKAFGHDRIVFSMDFYLGKLWCKDATFASHQPEEILKSLIDSGVSPFILLDLADVGRSAGPSTIHWCKKLKSMKPDCTVITGGGIRDISDFKMALENDVNRILVSTWLHLTKLP